MCCDNEIEYGRDYLDFDDLCRSCKRKARRIYRRAQRERRLASERFLANETPEERERREFYTRIVMEAALANPLFGKAPKLIRGTVEFRKVAPLLKSMTKGDDNETD